MGTITLLQSTDGGFGSGATPVTSSAVGFANPTNAGSLLICLVWADALTINQPITINLPVTSGFTWSAGVGISEAYVNTSSHQHGIIKIFYILNAASMPTSATTTVEATQTSGTNLNVEFSLYEFAASATVYETAKVAANSTATPSTIETAALTTAHTDLIFMAMISETAAGTAGSGFTIGVDSTELNGFGSAQYILQESAGTFTPAFGNSTTYWATLVVAFTVTAPTALPSEMMLLGAG